MQDSTRYQERKINPETSKFIGKFQLQKYGAFSDSYNKNLILHKQKQDCSCKIKHVYTNMISIKPSCDEAVTILDLVSCDDKLLSRMLASLASICNEMQLIIREGEELFQHFLFYEDINTIAKPTILFAKKTFRNIQKVSSLTTRANQVISLLLIQLNSLIGKGFNNPSSGSNFTECIDYLADILVVLMTFDELISIPLIKQHASQYLLIVQNILHDPNQFNTSSDKLKFLESDLSEIQEKLLKGNIFKNSVHHCSTYHISSPGLIAEFTAHINHLLTEIDRDEDSESINKFCLQVNGLMAFQFGLFGDIDSKILKKLLEVDKKIGSCVIVGCKLWYPEDFLLKQIPKFAKLFTPHYTNNGKSGFSNARSQTFLKDSSVLCAQASSCTLEIEKLTKQDMRHIEVKDIYESMKVLIEALKVIKRIGYLTKWILRIHIDKNLPISKSTLLSLCRLIEVLKCMQLTFNRNLPTLLNMIMLISQHLTYRSLSMLHNVKKNLAQDRTYKQKQLDVLSALAVCEQSMKGPNTKERILVAKLALSASGLQKDSSQEIKYIMNRLEIFNNLQSSLERFCDCSFLYEHIESLIPTYFSKLLGTNIDISRYYIFMFAFNDCTSVNPDAVTSIEESLKMHFLNPLTQIIETNLRLQTHLHLTLPHSDPFVNYLSLNFTKTFPIELKRCFWSPKNETEHYLSTMFYNLTTVVLHDWQTYGEMRRLASLEYQLETVEDNLPTQTIEQGLDILEIMRNIQTFVCQYLYNLNSQVFVEETSNNKHLNTINIAHIANSIRTHGIGITNTTVNYTYQFLQKKFAAFSQFMFDERIKSRLLKNLKYFTHHKEELNQMYPYERAEKFNYGIKKLGLDEADQSYLDLFRKLISHIGNAMGFVRLIRSGFRRSLAEGTCFLPDLKKTDTIYDNLLRDELPPLTKTAATSFIKDLDTFIDNFEESTEYFKLLVDVFVPILRDPKHIHLKNFFMIVPPLTINFVEHSITCKERLNKKNRNDAVFTDDGFAMGLAFIIELLGQEDQMNSLHWFQSAHNKFHLEKQGIHSQRTSGDKQDEKLQQTLSLTEKRILTYEREFQLLYCNFQSAKIFFQS